MDPQTGNALYVLTHKRVLKFLYLFVSYWLPTNQTLLLILINNLSNFNVDNETLTLKSAASRTSHNHSCFCNSSTAGVLNEQLPPQLVSFVFNVGKSVY